MRTLAGMVNVSWPFAPTAGQPSPSADVSQGQWADLFAHTGEGVINDLDGTGFAATASASAGTVTIAPGAGKVRGMGLDASDPQTFNLAGTGTQPAVGQSRVDRVVLRLDETAKTLTRYLLAGSPATTGQQATPQPARQDGLWDVLLWRITRTITAAGATVSVTDERAWAGPTLYIAGGAFPAGATIGTKVLFTFADAAVGTRTEWWIRSLDPTTGRATWLRSSVDVELATASAAYSNSSSQLNAGKLVRRDTSGSLTVPAAQQDTQVPNILQVKDLVYGKTTITEYLPPWNEAEGYFGDQLNRLVEWIPTVTPNAFYRVRVIAACNIGSVAGVRYDLFCAYGGSPGTTQGTVWDGVVGSYGVSTEAKSAPDQYQRITSITSPSLRGPTRIWLGANRVGASGLGYISKANRIFQVEILFENTEAFYA